MALAQSPELPLILIRGAGRLGSGIAWRLSSVGYPVIMTDLPQPTTLYHPTSFATAIYTQQHTLEGRTARHINPTSALWLALRTNEIPVIIDDVLQEWRDLNPAVIVDARSSHADIDTEITDAPLVIGIGTTFSVGHNCHATITTQRGHHFGRLIWPGIPTPHLPILPHPDAPTHIYAPTDGHLIYHATFGEMLQAHQLIATLVDTPIHAPVAGCLYGLIHPSTPIWQGLPIAAIDPHGNSEYCYTISAASRTISGAVLEAILSRDIYPFRRDEREYPDATL